MLEVGVTIISRVFFERFNQPFHKLVQFPYMKKVAYRTSLVQPNRPLILRFWNAPVNSHIFDDVICDFGLDICDVANWKVVARMATVLMAPVVLDTSHDARIESI